MQTQIHPRSSSADRALPSPFQDTGLAAVEIQGTNQTTFTDQSTKLAAGVEVDNVNMVVQCCKDLGNSSFLSESGIPLWPSVGGGC